MEDYKQQVMSKLISRDRIGFEIAPESFNAAMREDQRQIVAWSLRIGTAGIFADCGLGKTLMQLERAYRASLHTGKVSIILTPPAVAEQTVNQEAPKFGYTSVVRVWDQADVEKAIEAHGARGLVVVTNYERLHLFDLSSFGDVELDESSILANYTGKTKQMLVSEFAKCPLKGSWSGTPAPNNHLEIGNHAEFLGIMKSNEMISRWFINDTMAAGNYRLKGHAAQDFWRWVSTWAVCITSPEDMGYDATGFDLPPLNVHEVVVSVDQTIGAGDGEIFRTVELSSTSIHREMRLTAPARARAVADMVNASTDIWVVWCNTDYEADELVAMIPDAIEVRGSHPEKRKVDGLNQFTEGRARVIITKPSIGGMGLNWQHAHKTAFVGLSYSFKDLYQALCRLYRFGQESPVDAYIFMAETEQSVLDNVKDKMKRFREMQKEMCRATMERHEIGQRKPTTEIESAIACGNNWELYRGDCVDYARTLESDSVGYSIFSPPFANLYIYSDSIFDMGNCADYAEFFAQYEFLSRELFRVTIPGRLCSIHCKDLPLYKGRDGAAGLYDFPGDIIRNMEQCGWTFHSRVTIWKDPVIEMQRTKNHGLLYKELCKDSACSRQGMADYVLTFRKWTEEQPFPAPVHRGKERFEGEPYIGASGPVQIGLAKAGAPTGATGDVYWENEDGATEYTAASKSERLRSIEIWQRYASPVWFDIQQTEVLNYRLGRDTSDERHICPLQLGVIRRCIDLWTNPGDVVFSPFAGIGSEGFEAVKAGREFRGSELKESYWGIACRNLNSVSAETELDIFTYQETTEA